MKLTTILMFFVLLMLWHLAVEINLSFSSYGVRKKRDYEIYDNKRYYDWFVRMEPYLWNLYQEEYCDEMQLNFDEFCRSIYCGGRIVYDKPAMRIF